MLRPVLLDPDNFTSPQRTPWGGRRLARGIKAGLGLPVDAPIGESWELSGGPELPSRAESGEPLSELIAADPRGWLGREARRGGTALLVKLLDAAEPLSVQIHPSDRSPGLAPDESGKPESWYVVEADPGAGIFLGLAPAATPASVRRAIEDGADLSRYLSFVPARVGDFFVVEAGTPHAIGAGVTLVEPQHVRPGRRGVTYRYWDWNRRYDRSGQPDPQGAPRALHVEEALAVTRWRAPRGRALLREVRARAGAPRLDSPPRWKHLCGPGGALPSRWLDVRRVAGSGRSVLPEADSLRALTVLEGTIELGGVTAGAGRTVAVPASATSLALRLERAHAVLSAAR